MGIIETQYKEKIAQSALDKLDKAEIDVDDKTIERDFYDTKVDGANVEVYILLDHEDEGIFKEFRVLDTDGDVALKRVDEFEKTKDHSQIIKFAFKVIEEVS